MLSKVSENALNGVLRMSHLAGCDAMAAVWRIAGGVGILVEPNFTFIGLTISVPYAKGERASGAAMGNDSEHIGRTLWSNQKLQFSGEGVGRCSSKLKDDSVPSWNHAQKCRGSTHVINFNWN